jgi:hypothetical protein
MFHSRTVCPLAVSLALTLVSGSGFAAQAAAGPGPIWIEAEDFAASNFAEHWQRSSMGKEALLSGGQWLMRGLNADEIQQLVPGEA